MREFLVLHVLFHFGRIDQSEKAMDRRIFFMLRRDRLFSAITILLIVLFLFVPPSIRFVEAQQADAEILVAKGSLAYEDKRYEKALTLLQKAIALDPQNSRALYYIGLVYLAQKKPALAAESLEAARKIRPSDLFIRYQLGVAYFAQSKYDLAEPLLTEVFREQPQLENLGFYVGFLRYRAKDHEGALEAFKVGKTTDPNIRQLTLFYRGLSLGVLGLPKEAIVELDKAQAEGAVSPFTQSAVRLRESLAAGKEVEEKRRLRLQGSLGGYYDDNLAINPNAITIPNPDNDQLIVLNNIIIEELRQRKTKSGGMLASALVDYSWLRHGPWESTASYSFLQTLNFNDGLSRFNIQDHLGNVAVFYRGVLGKVPFQLQPNFTFDYFLLGNAAFLSWITTSFSATLVPPTFTAPYLGDVGNLTTAIFRYQDKTFYNEVPGGDPRFQSQFRDGFDTMFGFVHAFRFVGDQILLRLGYQYNNENTTGSDFSYSGNRFITGGQATLPWGGAHLSMRL